MPEALIRGAFQQAARFHGQPLDRKMEVRVDKHNVGYLPMRGDTLRTSTVQTVTKANLNEAFFMARDLPDDHPDVVADRRFRSANRWPKDLPGFREAVVGYCDALERLVEKLVRLYAVALELPAAYFDDPFREFQYKLRMTHYPYQEALADDEFGIAPHTDTSFLTLLAPNDVPGLSIRTQSGKWIDAPRRARRLCREWRPDAAALDQRRLPGHPAPRGQPQRRRALCPGLLLRQPHRLAGRLGADLVGPDRPPKYPTTWYTDYMIQYQKRTYDLLADANRQAAE